ncbi:MAG TPA: ABC transporter substrate-binding protein [Herbaspirillum sp.]
MKKTRKFTGLAGACVCMTFVLAAAAVPPCAAGQAAPMTTVNVALGDVSMNKVPFLIAADAGIYARNGLDVHQFLNPEAVRKARASGVIVPPEYTSENIDDAPISVGGGAPMITRFVNNNAIQRVIVLTTEEVVRDHVLAQPSIASMQDLKGKRIGFTAPGTVTNYDTLAFIRKMGWQQGKDVTLVENASSVKALRENKTDALLGSALTASLARQNHFKDLGSLEQFNIPLAGSGVMIENKWLAANRDASARFVKATVEAIALMKSDRSVFNAALVKWFNIKDQVTQDHMFAAVGQFPAKPYPSVEGVKALLDIYDSPAMRKHHADEFIDASFIAALDKSGYLDKLGK